MMGTLPIDSVNSFGVIDGNYLYTFNQDANYHTIIEKIDLSTHTVVASNTLDHGLSGLAISSGKLYSVSNDSGNVEVYDITDLSYIKDITFTNGASDVSGENGVVAIAFMNDSFQNDVQKLDTSTDTLGTILTLGADSAYFLGGGNGYAVLYMSIESGFAGIKIIRLSDMTVVASVAGSQTNASEYNGVIDVADGTSTVLEYSESDWTSTPKTFSHSVIAVQKYDGGYITGTPPSTNEIYDNDTLLGSATNMIVKVLKEPNAISAITNGEYIYFGGSTPVTTDYSLDISSSVGVAQASVDHEINVLTDVRTIKYNTLIENADVRVLRNFPIDKTLEVQIISDHAINAGLETRIEKSNTLLENVEISVKNIYLMIDGGLSNSNARRDIERVV
ncbi:MAG: hypothetical protein M1521_03730, partial [Thermotogae bacterium]|nr:hypothetical protein [Thermotogota bacterium]